MVLAERRQWDEAAPCAGSLLVHAALFAAVCWGVFKPIVVTNENAVDVEIVNQNDLRNPAKPAAASLPSAPAGGTSEGIPPSGASPGPPSEQPVHKLLEIGDGWYRSRTMFSQAEISDPRHARLKAKLSQLESETRTVQICNLEAILQITRSGLPYHPEFVVAYAMADVVRRGAVLVADGAAFQSDGGWYNLSFRCRVSPGSQVVEGFEFAIGQAIPRQDWEADGLPARPVGLAEE